MVQVKSCRMQMALDNLAKRRRRRKKWNNLADSYLNVKCERSLIASSLQMGRGVRKITQFFGFSLHKFWVGGHLTAKIANRG